MSKILEFILIKVDEDDLTSLLGANPEYKEYITVEHGKMVLYLSATAATNKLFVVTESELLNEEKSKKFHHIVAKLL